MPERDIEPIVITAGQMRAIEERLFAAGMPVAALMEKAAVLVARRFVECYPLARVPQVGVLVGPGHNGGDALVVARELHLHGYIVSVYRAFSQLKELTASHAAYAEHLGIAVVEDWRDLQNCDVLVEGLFGFGQTRAIALFSVRNSRSELLLGARKERSIGSNATSLKRNCSVGIADSHVLVVSQSGIVASTFRRTGIP